METDAEKIVQEITDIITNNNCNITNKAVLDLAIYMVEREKKVILSL